MICPVSIISSIRGYRHFYNVVTAVFKQVVCLLNLREGEGMSYQWGSVNLSFRDKSQNFITVATIYSAGLERKILAIHIRQG